jgi:SAM-dependent methyltransferase
VTAGDDPAAWYDVLNPWGPSDDSYLGLGMAAGDVLDVGCGTGTLLHRARDAGHTGRLCGLDPDLAMLDQARTRSDIGWELADAASAAWDREFDLAVIASHAFQELVGDDELRGSLRAIRAALCDGGRFAFETRHPLARTWEGWTTSLEARNSHGDVVRVTYELQDVTGDVSGSPRRCRGGGTGRRWATGPCDSSTPTHWRRSCTTPASPSTSSSATGGGER